MSEEIFQSTHPVRGATRTRQFYMPRTSISIHAPREGCDLETLDQIAAFDIISIHAPREGCDVPHGGNDVHHAISIHAPREGCDDSVRI